ncbi:PIR Superfamily Protein [Plasmodium ovale curtisi]|uniref:PIR Superfamily Protein n=1 Tax=Plasmodium ovale curtisi TaxID=864141 RepID=A0A1A8XFP4_PLAOA|nr:PIR Superfamily Protein [Plasmodium ovale curtisi]SBT02741.1 PIR Superfamily Protein [Plasmodium ovale curtisi]
MDSEDDNNLNLPSDKCYNELDTEYIDDGNDEKCEKLKKNSGEYTKAALLCMGLKGNLEKYDALNIFGKMNHYKCKYLSLWAYDRLSKLEENEQTNTKSSILTIWGKSEKHTKEECISAQFATYSKSIPHITEKNLYDYALNYEDLENRCKASNTIPCTTKLAEYIRISKELYNQVKKECKPSQDTNFQRSCIALRDIQEIYPNDELLNLKCERIEDGNKSSRNHERRGFEGELTESYSFGSNSSGDASSSDSYKAIGTSLPILSVLPIGFVLYKFTGLGPMARNLLRRGRINGINSQEELTHELLENPYDSNAHPDLAETYIGYQPI